MIAGAARYRAGSRCRALPIAGWIRASTPRARRDRELAEHLREERVGSGSPATVVQRCCSRDRRGDRRHRHRRRIGREIVRATAPVAVRGRPPRRRHRRGRDHRVRRSGAGRLSCHPRAPALRPTAPGAPAPSVPAATTARSSARWRCPRRLRGPPRRERAARFRRQREPRAADADRRARLCSRRPMAADEDDPAVQRRSRSRWCGRPNGWLRIVDDLLDLSLIETKEAAELEPLAGSRRSCATRSSRCGGAADVAGIADPRVADSRPTSWSRAIAASS